MWEEAPMDVRARAIRLYDVNDTEGLLALASELAAMDDRSAGAAGAIGTPPSERTT